MNSCFGYITIWGIISLAKPANYSTTDSYLRQLATNENVFSTAKEISTILHLIS
jgi:hypothetical protein